MLSNCFIWYSISRISNIRYKFNHLFLGKFKKSFKYLYSKKIIVNVINIIRFQRKVHTFKESLLVVSIEYIFLWFSLGDFCITESGNNKIYLSLSDWHVTVYDQSCSTLKQEPRYYIIKNISYYRSIIYMIHLPFEPIALQSLMFVADTTAPTRISPGGYVLKFDRNGITL